MPFSGVYIPSQIIKSIQAVLSMSNTLHGKPIDHSNGVFSQLDDELAICVDYSFVPGDFGGFVGMLIALLSL